MNILSKTISLLSKSILFYFLVITSIELKAQEKTITNLSSFKITIEKRNGGINLVCHNGCAWSHLEFSMNANHMQFIDEYGMTEEKKVKAEKNPLIADFLFSISRTLDGINLKGIQGTSWSELNYKDSRKGEETIDEMGLVK